MKVFDWIIMAAFVFFVAAMVVMKLRGIGNRRRGVVKVLASLSFVAVAVRGVLLQPSLLRGLLLAGVCFAFIGDVLLIFMDNHLCFKAGVAAFFLASLSLSCYIFSTGLFEWWFVILLAAFLVLNALMQIKGVYDFGDDAVLLNLYTAMVATCGTLGLTLITHGAAESAALALGLGCLLYFVSDIFLGLNLFRFRSARVDCINTLTYFPGLMLVAISLML